MLNNILAAAVLIISLSALGYFNYRQSIYLAGRIVNETNSRKNRK